MRNVPRRTFLSFLSGVPIVSDWMEVLGIVRPQKLVPDERTKDVYLAVETLRLINTMEKWNFLETKRHVSREELGTSQAYKKLVELQAQKRYRRAIDAFDPADSFQIPAPFEVFVEPSADRSQYVAMVSVKRSEYSFAYVSGEEGAIFQVGEPTTTAAAEKVEWLKRLVAERPAQREKIMAERASGTGLFATILGTGFVSWVLSSLPQGGSPCVCCDPVCGLPPVGCAPPCYCRNDCPESSCPDGEVLCCSNVGCDTCNCIWCRYTRCEFACETGGCPGCDYCCSQGGGSCFCVIC